MAEKYDDSILLAAYARLKAESDSAGCDRVRALMAANAKPEGKEETFAETFADATNHEALAAGMKALASPEHRQTRMGGKTNRHADHIFRGRLADLLQDHGRDEEAGILRDPEKRVLVQGDRVVDHFAHAVNRAKQEITDDIREGVVPATVHSFGQLHDYVDANHYGGAFEDDLALDDNYGERLTNFWNRVQGEVHRWLGARRQS